MYGSKKNTVIPVSKFSPTIGKVSETAYRTDVFGVRRKVRGSDGERTHTVRRFSVAVWL